MANEVRELIRDMSHTNPTWGSPRIVGALRKLGIEVAKSTIDTYRVRSKLPPSPAWQTTTSNRLATACDKILPQRLQPDIALGGLIDLRLKGGRDPIKADV